MLAETNIIQTIVREIPADLETPTSVYLKLRGQGPSFLLESVEGGERIARYSFIGVSPRAQYILRGNEIQIIEGNVQRIVTMNADADPTHFLAIGTSSLPIHASSGHAAFHRRTGRLFGLRVNTPLRAEARFTVARFWDS